jgi:hypothetical protein
MGNGRRHYAENPLLDGIALHVQNACYAAHIREWLPRRRFALSD